MQCKQTNFTCMRFTSHCLINQYSEDDFLFRFVFLKSFQRVEKHKNVNIGLETKTLFMIYICIPQFSGSHCTKPNVELGESKLDFSVNNST